MSFDYLNLGSTPDSYVCKCGASGVRLYRQYQTFADQIKLLCRSCAMKDQKEKEFLSDSEHSIGLLVAAVPTLENDTYWGFTSVPDDGVTWWDTLPKI